MCLLTANGKKLELSDTTVAEVGPAIMASNRKSNNKERRREKSKIAARNRRGKECEVFEDLGEMIPVPDSVRESLDKASIVRLANCTIKLQNLTNYLDSTTCIGSEIEEAQNMCAALGGFLVVVCANGDILLTSENITISLGLAHYDVMGRSIYEFSHPCDHRDVKDLLRVSQNQENLIQRSALIRLKCTLTAKGSCVHIRAATDKVIRFTGKMFYMGEDLGHYFIGIGEPIATPTDNNTSPFKSHTFKTTHSADFKCICTDESVTKCMGYDDNDMIGKPLFDFQHGVDAENVSKHFKALHGKGQVRTEPYRFLAKKGGWAWVITEASVLKPSGNSGKTSNFVCRHIMISEVQNQHEILSVLQTPDLQVKNEHTDKNRVSGNENLLQLPVILNEVAANTTPVLSTSKIFAPRTEDMDTGFLMPYDCSQTVVDHADLDLTHLAPIAGDECVPLNSELFDNFLNFINSSSSEYPVLDIDELDFLNSSDGSATYVPIEEFDISEFDDGTISPVLHDSDPLLGSTININLSATPAPGPISDHDTALTGFDMCDPQQQLDPSLFDLRLFDMELPGGDPSTSILPTNSPSPPGHQAAFLNHPIDADTVTGSRNCNQTVQQNSNNNALVVNKNLQSISPPKISFLEIEQCLLKRKAEGNTPKVVTKSVFSQIRNMGKILQPFPPKKLQKLSNTSSQFIRGYVNQFDASTYSHRNGGG